MLDGIVCVCVGFVRRGLVGVVNPLVRSPCKGCKEEGRRKGEYLGYLHDTGSSPVYGAGETRGSIPRLVGESWPVV